MRKSPRDEAERVEEQTNTAKQQKITQNNA